MAVLCNLAKSLNTTTLGWSSEQNCMQLLSHASNFWEWFNRLLLRLLTSPIVWTWLMTFFVVYLLISLLGFAPQGVVAGSLAATLQSTLYGGFTPAGGIFATFTSLAMLGFLNPIGFGLGVLVASVVTAAVWVR